MNIDYVVAHLDPSDRITAIIWDGTDEPEVALTLGWLNLTLSPHQAKQLHAYLEAQLTKLDEKGYWPPGASPPDPEDVYKEGAEPF